jgi:hypothetical protein
VDILVYLECKKMMEVDVWVDVTADEIVKVAVVARNHGLLADNDEVEVE